jgi:hypothetical protein
MVQICQISAVEIVERYGPDDVVTRFIRKAEQELVSSVARTGQRLSLVR